VAANGLVRIPVHRDDFELHTGGSGWADWERGALKLIEERRFAAIGLHDCYAEHWLPHYRGFLERASGLGPLRTLDDVADEVARSACDQANAG
jgi:hypothetical protein